jgi:hypothetical protein
VFNERICNGFSGEISVGGHVGPNSIVGDKFSVKECAKE